MGQTALILAFDEAQNAHVGEVIDPIDLGRRGALWVTTLA